MYSCLCILVTYNGSEWTRKCLNSLRTSSLVPDIFCVDNNSSDATVEIIKAEFPEVMVIESKENLGFGRANNIGLKYAFEHDYDFVFLLNQDAWVEKDTIEKLVNISKDQPEFGIISPIHLNGKGDRLDFRFSSYLSEENTPFLLSDLLKGNKKEFYETKFVNAAAWLLPRKTLELIGGFDPMFNHYGEDDNYCQRVLFHGLKIGIHINAFIHHDRPQTFKYHYDYRDLATFERMLKIRVANVNQDGIEARFKKELNKVRSKYFASLATIDFRNASKWRRFIQLAQRLKKEIEHSFLTNKQKGSTHIG